MAIVGNLGFISWIITVLRRGRLDAPHCPQRRIGLGWLGPRCVECPCLEFVLKSKNKIVGVFLLNFAFGAAAVSLGEIRGAAWIGQALDVRVSIELDQSISVESSCLEAEVFYGDVPQSPGRVRVSVEPSSKATSATARIQSLNPVNEPVVSLSLRAGCLAKIARRFVMLADIPTNLVGDSNLVSAAIVSPAVSTGFAVPVEEKINEAVLTRATARKNRVTAQVPLNKVDQPQKFSEPRVKKNRSKTVERKSRLSLDPLEPLELRFERIQTDRPIHASTIPLADLPADPSIQSQSDTQDAQRLKKLEADVLSMQAQLVKGDESMSQLRDRLKQAQSERYDNAFVYSLLALLMGALAYLVYLLRRQAQEQSRMSQAWFESVQAVNDESDDDDLIKPVPSMLKATQVADASVRGAELMEVDLDDLLHDPANHKARSEPAAEIPKNKLQFNKLGVKTDPRQHAEFLVSLGQSDQAIKILSTAIDDDEKVNSLIYLDLLKIYHAMGMRDDYKRLSAKFTSLFKAHLPTYVNFRNEGKDLTTYEEVIAQISLYWTSPQAVDVINTFIYTDPMADPEEHVDLQAFRDLLLLRAVALNKLEAPLPQGQSAREMNSVIWQG